MNDLENRGADLTCAATGAGSSMLTALEGSCRVEC